MIKTVLFLHDASGNGAAFNGAQVVTKLQWRPENGDHVWLTIRNRGIVVFRVVGSCFSATEDSFYHDELEGGDEAEFELWIDVREVNDYKPKIGCSMDVSVDELDIGLRAKSCLASDDISSIGQLCERTEQQLLRIHNLGKKTLREIKESLEQRGLKLKG